MNHIEYTVYLHRNTINNKVYIGVTRRKPTARWCAGNGYKHNKPFTADIHYYGWDVFRHDIILCTPDKDEAFTLEKRLIAQYNATDPRYGYNISTGGEHSGEGHACPEHVKKMNAEYMRNRVISAETRKRISEGNIRRFAEMRAKGIRITYTCSDEKRRHMSEAIRGRVIPSRRKPIIDMETGKVYPCLVDASRDTGVSIGVISRHCNGYATHSRTKHKWRYYHNEDAGNQIAE